MPDSKIKIDLPMFLKPLFWEINFEHAQLKGHETYVIERVIEYGDDRAIKWLLQAFSARIIINVVKKSRRISPNTANLWSLVLDIPKKDIVCLSTPSTIQSTSFLKV